jgi:hypothetical protein
LNFKLLRSKSLFIFLMLIVVWIVISTFILLNTSIIRAQDNGLDGLIMNSTLSLSGIFLAVIGILIAIYWSNALSSEIRRSIKLLLVAITFLTVLSGVTCLVAFVGLLFETQEVILPLVVLFFSTIYFFITSTVMLVWISVGR